MISGWIKPDQLFDGQDVVSNIGLRIEENVIVAVRTPPQDALPVAGCLTPGFVDLQVNGGGGTLLNNTPTYAGMQAIAAAHRRMGTVAILPTVITDAPHILEQAANAALSAKNDPEIIGLHIEGPHIVFAKRGTHNPDFIRPLDDQTVQIIHKLRTANIPVMITLAPEAAGLDQITKLSRMGAVVSLGHTDATASATNAAIAAGAHCATHLFNAMSQMTGRAAGALGAIVNADIYAGIICDGHHVDDQMVGLALRARPLPDRMFLVSDAMATVAGPDAFTLYGQDIRLQNGRLINAEGNLAGAHTTQAEGVRRLVQSVGIPLAQALRMAVTIPATVIGRPDLAVLQGRSTADILRLDADLKVLGTLADL